MNKKKFTKKLSNFLYFLNINVNIIIIRMFGYQSEVVYRIISVIVKDVIEIVKMFTHVFNNLNKLCVIISAEPSKRVLSFLRI